jgi:ABC-type transport system involved in Fe-S cluster assembly fused permease/ATPase subunit
VTFAVYVAWTMRYIELSATARKAVNELDAQTSGKAVDALLNYETVRSRGLLTCARMCEVHNRSPRICLCRKQQTHH